MTDSADRAWAKVCNADDLVVGERREVTLPDGRLVLLVRTAHRLYACCADCPHQDTPLLDGFLDGDTLTCATHFWQWNLATGEPLGDAEMPLPLFQVKEADGNIYIRLDAARE